MPESTERGALTEAVYYILLSLYKPMHGYGVMQNVKEMSKGRVSLGAGTMYGAISTLLERGWVRPATNDNDSRKKEYVITNTGMEAVANEILRLEELLGNGRRIVGGVL